MSRAVKVGIFLVGGIVLFCVGLFLIGSEAQLFARHFVVYTDFNDIDTLQTGAKVRVSGMDAGEITGIQVPKGPSSEFRLKLKVDQKFHAIVREDSLASIETEGMVGNKFVNIKKGSENSPECRAGCTLPSQEAVSTGQLMREGDNIAKSLQSTIGHVDGLIGAVSPDIEKIASNSVHLTGNANAIVAGMRQGHGAAGKLLVDKTVASNVETTIANARQTSANIKQASGKMNAMISDVQRADLPDVHKTLENTQDMTQQLNQAVGSFLAPGNYNQSTAAALRDTVHGAQHTAENLADDTDAIKTNFFFRGFFNRRGFYDLSTLTPSKYAHTEFVKKPRARVWVPAAGLFTVRPDGSQELTDVGRTILDQSMSDLVPYLPNNPMVVEGYSTGGMPDHQYLVSRQRAVEVRRYLESRFHLKSERVGIMPLGDQPPKAVGKKMWDGVCLVLVVSKP
jgi:phospholipid/cholesterol/gamma-HCH transport system substrate-binding protein